MADAHRADLNRRRRIPFKRQEVISLKPFLLRVKSEDGRCMLWVALCFGLTSAVYLAWLNRLAALAPSVSDWSSLVAGYLLQAAGMGLTAWLIRRSPKADPRLPFQLTVLLLSAVSVPALLADTLPLLIAFGLVMNLLCGIISGSYLYLLSVRGKEENLSRIFGGGYALATVAVGLLSLPGSVMLLQGRTALIPVLSLSALTLFLAGRPGLFQSGETAPALEEASSIGSAAGSRSVSASRTSGKAKQMALAFFAVVLLSTVKNLGFNFPSADIQAGLIPELSRLPYALGLIAAGIIHDRSRKSGMLCTVAALIIPFLMLGLTAEPLPSTVFWGLDYLFFAFFSVFRAVLFLDIARHVRRPALAPLGLLAGRLGDAAGSGLGLALAGHRAVLILLAAALFFPTVWLVYRLYQKMYEPETVREKSEQEVFETFCLQHDFSGRERDVFRQLLSGRTNGEIAEALFITENTVKYHVRNLLQKTGCKNRTELQRQYTAALYPDMDTDKIRPFSAG